MKTTITALVSAAALAVAAPAVAQDNDVPMGILLGFTGPVESLAGPIAEGAELAASEVSESGALLDGATVTTTRGDSTCIDAAAATAAAERLVSAEGVHGIMGAMCSGATTAVLQNVGRPNGIVMISPSATSPALSTMEDNGFFFRTAPSDARQGQVIADILMDRGVDSAALTYTNNDYGKGLADATEAAFEDAGGDITIVAPHEDGKADYSAEVASLAAAGGDVLIVAGYLDQGGRGIIQASLDTGAFDTFVLPDGMVGDAIVEAIGDPLNGSFGVNPGGESEGRTIFEEMAAEAGFEPSVYTGEAYDGMALMLLAMQAAGSTDPAEYKDHVMDVANAPGETILPGQLAEGLQILADGGEVNYEGASAVELIGPGESAGTYREIEIRDNAIETVQFR
jgi:branched-chain amino acid transport system substrate-binding protein